MKDLIEKAETLLVHSRSIIRNNDGVSPEAAELIAEAQAVATLALAEQQRIANRIALGQFRVSPDDVALFRSLVIEPRGEYAVAPVDEIREGLGL
ncbi:hypothetical protein [Leifsonia sp. P73]|uniref:hypothetical protein n=1 Tax=Leifsonia sp. P73 TaxID=3423959 RepID=UPI003DA29271